MEKTILEQLEKILRDSLGKEDLHIKEEDSLINDLELTSLDIINLVGVIEDTFGIEILDEDISAIKTVKDVVNYIEEKRASNN